MKYCSSQEGRCRAAGHTHEGSRGSIVEKKATGRLEGLSEGSENSVGTGAIRRFDPTIEGNFQL